MSCDTNRFSTQKYGNTMKENENRAFIQLLSTGCSYLGCELDGLRQGQLRGRGLDGLLLFGWLRLLLLRL